MDALAHGSPSVSFKQILGKPVNIMKVLKSNSDNLLSDHTTKSKIIGRLSRIKNNHMRDCKMLNIQSRFTSSMYKSLNKMKYIIFSHKKYNDNGKEIKQTIHSPYPIRMTFFNGGTAKFPYSYWKHIWIERSKDITNKIILFDNEFARSEEGIKLFF
jgi:hypothetical protein